MLLQQSLHSECQTEAGKLAMGTTTTRKALVFTLAGMFSIVTFLLALEKISPSKAEAVARWFDPAILWIQRWLGAFYVPSLAILPLTIKGIPGVLLLCCAVLGCAVLCCAVLCCAVPGRLSKGVVHCLHGPP